MESGRKDMDKTEANYKHQIETYKEEYPHYKIYAKTLQEIMEKACNIYAPLAIVQSRPKSLSSFTRKAIRSAKDYADPVHDLMDLCGARVIVHTLDEMDLIGQFIKDHFFIDEKNSQDVSLRLKPTEFGYRGFHYIVQIHEKKILGIDIPVNEIGKRNAEIQVRTLLQHAWADMSHDRLYKNDFKVPVQWTRESARLAALLEDGDDIITRFVKEVDTYKLNYGAYMDKKKMEEEIKTLTTILDHEPEPKNKPRIALSIARIAKDSWDWKKMVDVLTPFTNTDCLEKEEILLELGHALCHVNRTNPKSEEYRKGQSYLETVAKPNELDSENIFKYEKQPDRIRAQALAFLAWSYRNIEGKEAETRRLYQLAYHCNPHNPYLLASYVEYEIVALRDTRFLPLLRHILLTGIRSCKSHAEAGLELPWAYFTMARLYLLLDEPMDSLCNYAKAIHLCNSKESCLPVSVFDSEMRFLNQVNGAKEFSKEYSWVQRLLQLAIQSRSPQKISETLYKKPIIILVGSTHPKSENGLKQYSDSLLHAFETFEGTIISGGTNAGIPGLIDSIVGTLRKDEKINTKLIGYLPTKTSNIIKPGDNYDELIEIGDDFSPSQPLQYWSDLISSGVNVSDIIVLGINGGEISSFEYRLALAMGATVAIIESSGGAATELYKDSSWLNAPGLLWFPNDTMTLSVLLHPHKSEITKDHLDLAAQAVHEKYIEENKNTPKDLSMRPWSALPENLRESNRQQVLYAETILRKIGYGIKPATSQESKQFSGFTDEQIEIMAEMEHGRYNVERFRDGWKFGPERDTGKKINPYLIAWDKLNNEIKDYDKRAVKNFPVILKKAGLEIYKLGDTTK